MTPADIDRVFGRGRLRMVTGDHVEVFREPSLPGERRRYTKRFLATAAGDFSEWTEREWRILARLVGHGIKPVPDVVRFDRGAADRAALVQTYDAGVTVDHWATLLPLRRDGTTLRNVFEDCAHWWALARHSLVALDAIHELHLVHLDLKADNICIPVGPADFDPHAPGRLLQPRFDDIALIDFAFSLVSGERLERALPIAAQAEYEYQSPRLLSALAAGRQGDLAPTRQLDWRCDLFSLAAMLWRYLPELEDTTAGAWTRPRHAKARMLVRRLIEAHDAALTIERPHAALIALADEVLAQPEFTDSLQRGWTLAIDGGAARAASPTPVTRIALPVSVPSARPARSATTAAAAAPAVRAEPIEPVADIAPAAAIARARPIAAERIAAAVAAEPITAAARAVEREPANEALAVDPTDVAVRLKARRREREQRARRLAWAGGLALAAVGGAAALFALEPPWRSPSALHDLRVAMTSPGTRAASSRNAPSAAMAALPATPPPATEAPTAVLPSEVKTVPAAVDVPAPTALSPSALSPPALSPPAASPLAPSPRGDSAPRTEMARAAAGAPVRNSRTATRAAAPTIGHAVDPLRPRLLARGANEAAPLAHGAAARSRPAMPFPASSGHRGAPTLAAATPTRSAARIALATSARRPGPSLASTRSTPTAWAVAGRAAPRLAAVRAVSGESGALRPPPAPSAAVAAERFGDGSASAAPGAIVGVNAAPTSANAAPGSTISAPTALAVVARPSLAIDGAANTALAAPAAFSDAPARAAETGPVDYAARASELMTQQVPRLAQHAERLVSRVLFVAGRSERVIGDDDIRAAARAVARDDGDALAGLPVSAREAERLGAAARAEYARRGGTPEALALQVRSFGANPRDAEAAGNLAFLLLRQRPPQPEAARQLALLAISLHGARFPEGRIEDWATLAIASALAGRERDASNAFLVTLSMAPNLEHHCQAALDVYALYGERLRAPVASMLQAASAAARGGSAPSCEWPRALASSALR